MLKEEHPSELQDCSPAAGRVYDALDRADGSLSQSDLQDLTHHAERTVRGVIRELQDVDLVRRTALDPEYQYTLFEDEFAP